MGKSSSLGAAKALKGVASAKNSSSFSSSTKMTASQNGKRRPDPENDLNGVSAKKRSRTDGVAPATSGKARTPFGGSKAKSAAKSSSGSKLSASSDTDKTEVFTAQHVRPARWQGNAVAAIALVRIQNEHMPPSSLIATSDDKVHKLTVGSILGRNVSSAGNTDGLSVAANKIDLGIGPSKENKGVSRKHLLVTEVHLGTNPSVRIQCCPRAENEVAIRRYDSGKNVMSPLLVCLNRDCVGGLSLEPGDVLIMDEYRRSLGRNDGNPQHTFRVMVVPVQARMSSATQAVDLTQESQHGVVQATVDLTSDSQHEDTVAFDMTSEKQPREADKKLPAQEPVDVDAVLTVVEKAEAPEAPEPSSQMPDTEEFTVSEPADDDNDKKMPAVPSSSARKEETAVASTLDGKDAPDAPQIHEESEEKTGGDEDKTGEDEFASQIGVAVVREPQVGDNFRVVFEEKDMFGRNVKTWFVGKAASVKGSDNAYSLDLKFKDDNNAYEYFPYPSGDVQILTGNPDDKLYVEFEQEGGGSKKMLAFDANPQELYVGDLVQCRFQNGPTWFRGRVSSTDKSTETCEIVYFDEECESGIPIGKGHVQLLQRGHSDLTWLENRKAPIVKKRRLGIIVKMSHQKDPDDCESVEEAHSNIHIKLDCGPHMAPELGTYSHIVPALLQSLQKKAKKNGKLYVWPAAGAKKSGKAKASKKQTAKKKQAVNKKTAASKNKTAPKARGRPRKTPVSKPEERTAESDEEDEESDVSDDFSLDLSRADEKEKRFLELAAEEQREEEISDTSSLSNAAILRPTLANAAIRAINSSEPLLGAELLAHYTFVDKKIPQAAQVKKLFDMMRAGPNAEGTFYPDPHKMQVTSSYILPMVRDAAFAQSIVSAGPSTWAELESYLCQVDAEIYCSPNDPSSTSATSLTRVADSLQVICCGLELVTTLMVSQLRSAMRDPDVLASKSYRDIPIVKAIRDGGRREARESLKFVTRTLAKAWANFGHFLIFKKDPSVFDTKGIDAFQRCTTEASRMMKVLGTICCSVAWVYCAEADIAFDSKDIAILVSDAIRSELDSSAFDLSPFFGKKKWKKASFKNKYWKKVKFRIVMLLDKSYSRPLQLNTAKLLHVDKELLHVMT